jgi:hypothetical protein
MIHIHNGDVTAAAARRAGLPGHHLPFRESLINGPVRLPYDVESRARALAELAGHNLLRVRNDLLQQERALAAALDQEVVLWFEHDLFCLVNLFCLLTRLAVHRRLTLVWSPEPLAQQDLDVLFHARVRVTPEVAAIARDAWAAYASPDPTALNQFLSSPAPGFAFLQEGLLLHASRFPSLRGGVGEIERRLMAGIATEAVDFVSLFTRIDSDPPRFGFGDGEVLRILRSMAGRRVPLISMIEEKRGAPPKVLLAITPDGEKVLEGTADDIDLNEPDFWLGGAHLTRKSLWRWDGGDKQLLSS